MRIPVTFARRLPVWVQLFLLILAASQVSNSEQNVYAAESAKNFVVVFIDDMGWSDLSCFGSEAVKTEHIDQLAAEGMRFTQFYVNAPICSPSRTALTTGQYPQRWRISSFLANRAENNRRGMAQWLELSARTVAESLHEHGYATGHFGKWHMGGQRDVGEAPLISEYGFDQSLTNFEGLGDRLLPLCYAYDGQPPKKHALGSDSLGRGEITWMDRSLITQGFVDQAIEFIAAAQKSGKPFFVNLWPDDVHSPFFPPERRRGDGSKQELYHGVLETMDEQLGSLFETIRKDERLSQNTIILFCSDNGPEPGAGSALPLKGNKGTLYEGGIRSPLIVWGPGFIEQDKVGTVNERSILCAMDLARSIVDIARVEEQSATTAWDGEVVTSILSGASEESRTAPIFWRRPPDRPGSKQENLPDLAMRDGRWKLLVEYDGSQPQLFDLSQDPSESNNLVAEQTSITATMTTAVVAWHQSLPADAGPSFEKERGSK
jgi:uncharacterized sulfatase